MPTSASSSFTQTTPALAGVPVSARARRLLQALYAAYAQALAEPLRLTLQGLEDELFAQAERARNSQVQADLYAQMRLLREQAPRFAPRFLEGLAQELALLCEPRRLALVPGGERGFHALSLVEDREIDRDIVLNEIARREAARCQVPLQLLGQRFGVLAAAPAYEAEYLPLGPHAACRALREASDGLALAPETQLTLYRVFERQVLERYRALIDHANAWLDAEGVLPGLVYLPYLPRAQATRKRKREPADAESPPSAAMAEPGSTPAGRRMPVRPLTNWNAQAPQISWNVAALDDGAAEPSAADAQSAPPTHRATEAAAEDLGPDATALARLRGLLAAAQAQPTTGGAPAGDGPDAVLPAQVLQRALGALQAQAVADETTAPLPRSFADLHQQLLALLRAEHGPQAQLSPQQADTFDLLGRLYQEIGREIRGGSAADGLLRRLQAPVARAALQDPGFFVRDQHPVRDLLNDVAEAGANGLDEEEQDPQLLHALDAAVARVATDESGDAAAFQAAHAQIQSHYRSQARKAEVAERRHVEAARGKERLAVARQRAADSMAQVCAEAAPPKFVQALLKQAWSDVLTLTLLRQGEQSDAWAEREQATARIAEVTCRPAGEAPDTGLGEEIEAALLQVGYHGDEAGAIARRLSTPGGTDELSSRTELAARLKARSRLGAQDEEAGTRRPPPTPRSDAEQAHYSDLRSLPFGTWFEFPGGPRDVPCRQRLSWYSPVTGHALFVNARGQKVAEHSLDALARLMAAGRARLLDENRGRLVDRAWQATLRALRSLAGAPAREPA